MARDLPDLFKAFAAAHGVELKQNTPDTLRIDGLDQPVTVLVERNDMLLTVADAEGTPETREDDRTFVVVVSTGKDGPALSGVTRYGQLMRLEEAVPTWHDLHRVLLDQTGLRWKAFSWAAELFRLVGDDVVLTEPAEQARETAAA